MKERQGFITDDMLLFLDDLRDSGTCNMFGAGCFVAKQYPELDRGQENIVLGYWMDTFGQDKR